MNDFIRIPEKRMNILRKTPKIKGKLEEYTRTKLKINDEISIDGESLNVFQTKNVLKAFGRGFDVDDSLLLLEDEYGLEIMDLTEHVKSKDRLMVLKGRIIGTNGKTKKFIEKYTDVKLSIFGKTVGILGRWDKINFAKEAISMLIKGCSHQILYRWLEQHSRS